MAIHGNLATMPVPELLQWAEANRKTGLLRLEQGGVATKLFIEEGRVTGCISDDPPYLLGQFLLFRGVITEEVLRNAMAEQQVTGRSLSDALVDRDLMSREDLDREVAAKAEETILSLFHWPESDALFWFRENTRPDRKAMRVNLEIRSLLVRGAARREELGRVRRIFDRGDVTPARVGIEVDPAEIEDFPSRQVYLAVDGVRGLEKIALRVHGTEFQVARRLLALQQRGVLTLGAADEAVTAEEASSANGALPSLSSEYFEADLAAGFEPMEPAEEDSPEFSLDPDDMQQRSDAAEAQARASEAAGATEIPETAAAVAAEPELVEEAEAEEASEEVESHLGKAREHVDESDHEAALEHLEQAREVDPGHPSISTIRSGAEAALVQRFLSDGLTPNRVPVVAAAPEAVSSAETTPAQDYLLKQADGNWDIQSLLSVAPLRPVELLSALHGLVVRGLIELRAPSE